MFICFALLLRIIVFSNYLFQYCLLYWYQNIVGCKIFIGFIATHNSHHLTYIIKSYSVSYKNFVFLAEHLIVFVKVFPIIVIYFIRVFRFPTFFSSCYVSSSMLLLFLRQFYPRFQRNASTDSREILDLTGIDLYIVRLFGLMTSRSWDSNLDISRELLKI